MVEPGSCAEAPQKLLEVGEIGGWLPPGDHPKRTHAARVGGLDKDGDQRAQARPLYPFRRTVELSSRTQSTDIAGGGNLLASRLPIGARLGHHGLRKV